MNEDKIRVKQFTTSVKTGNALDEPYFRLVEGRTAFGGNFKTEESAQKAADAENEKRRPR